MLIFLYGPDTFRSRRKLNEIIERYKAGEMRGANLKYFEGKGLSYNDFIDETKQISMFKEKKLLVLKNVFLNYDFKEKFLKDAKNYLKSQDIIIFYEEDAPKKTDLLFGFLKKEAKTQEFSELEGIRVKKWAELEFKKLGAKIETDALEKLVYFIGNNLWQLNQEIQKLAAFRQGLLIKEEDVLFLAKPKIESDIFETIDALGQRNKKKAVLLVKAHLAKGDHPAYLLSMINFQFRNLLSVKELIEKGRPYYVLPKETGLHPFVVKKSSYLCQKFSFPELKKIYQKIFQADLDIKTGKVEPETALDLLIAQI